MFLRAARRCLEDAIFVTRLSYRATAQHQTCKLHIRCHNPLLITVHIEAAGYVHPRKKMMAETAIKITKSQTRLKAIRSARLNLRLRPIQVSLYPREFIY